MQFSGYNHEFRYRVVNKALNIYDKNKQEMLSVPMLGENQGSEARNKKCRKKNKRETWYAKQKEIDGIMFVQPTANSELKKEIQKCANKNNMKLKVIEKVDNSLRKELQRSNPFKKPCCERENCIICQLEPNVNCRARGCIYEIQCEECRRKYIGQTGNSAHERINQHFYEWERRIECCPLYRHSQIYHNNNNFPVKVKILKTCFGDPTLRHITEAVLIDELSGDQTINNKNEWTYVKLNKLRIN